MKCLRCGKEVEEGTKYCNNCGFDVESQKDYRIVYKEVDPEVEKSKKTNLIDSPVLTFIFGILSMINALLIAGSKPIPIFYLLTFIIIFSVCFYLSTKKAKVKLRPFREVGVVLAFIALALVLIVVVKTIIYK